MGGGQQTREVWFALFLDSRPFICKVSPSRLAVAIGAYNESGQFRKEGTKPHETKGGDGEIGGGGA